MRRSFTAAGIALLLGLVACGERRDAPAAQPPPSAPGPAMQAPRVPRDEAALGRGTRMLDEARACEAGLAQGAMAPCERACRLGHSNSCYRTGQHWEAKGGADALARARALHLEACAGGSGGGCEAAARMYRGGRGVAADAAEADRLFQRARIFHRVHCEQGYAPSCAGLAGLFRNGLGGPAHEGLAADYDRRACALGVTARCPP